MNKLRPILFALTAVAYPARATLITNGGFETGDFTGWSTSTNHGTASVTGMFNGISPHSGSDQAVFSGLSAATTATQTITTTPGTSYTIDFFLALTRGPFGGDPTLGVTFGGVQIYSNVFSSGFGYTKFSFNVTASSASSDLEFLFEGGQLNPTTFYLDDVSVNAAGVPDGGSTVSLLGCLAAQVGLLGPVS